MPHPTRYQYPLINYLLYLLQCNFNMCNLVSVCCCIKWLVVVTNTVDCKKNFRLPRDLAIYMSWLFYYLRVSFSRSLFDTLHTSTVGWIFFFILYHQGSFITTWTRRGGRGSVESLRGVTLQRVDSSDEFELEFSSSSRAMKVPSRAGALQFSSWNRADNMYIIK